MTIEVWLFVVLLAVALLVGAAIALLGARRRVQQHAADQQRALDKLTRAEAEAHEARVQISRGKVVADELEATLATLQADLVGVEAERDAARVDLERLHVGASATDRQLSDFRERFTDVVGLESEVATLRVIAARVPALEAELSALRAAEEAAADPRSDEELDPGEGPEGDDPVIDLRHPECQSSAVRARPGGSQGNA